MSRIIGCESLFLAPVTKDDATGTTFGAPKSVPSLISIDISDQTDNVTFYSDDRVEQVIPSFTGKEVTIELGYLTNELEGMISGNDFTDGVLTQTTVSNAGEFALMFRAPKSRGGAFSYVCLYKGVLSKEESKYKGKEDKMESSNVTLKGVFMPLVSNGKVSIKADSDDASPSPLIKTWFDKVPVVEDKSVTQASSQEKSK